MWCEEGGMNWEAWTWRDVKGVMVMVILRRWYEWGSIKRERLLGRDGMECMKEVEEGWCGNGGLRMV